MMSDISKDKIWVVVDDTLVMRDKVNKKELDVATLSNSMNLFLAQLETMLEQTPESVGKFRFEEFEISAEVTAQGTLAILGTGLQAGATGGLRFVFRRAIPS
jgi:hypothetical protein